jgi:hypothetical protein
MLRIHSASVALVNDKAPNGCILGLAPCRALVHRRDVSRSDRAPSRVAFARAAASATGFALTLSAASPVLAEPTKAERCVQNYEFAQTERQAAKWTEASALFHSCSDAACPEMVRQECVAWAQVADRELKGAGDPRAAGVSSSIPLAAPPPSASSERAPAPPGDAAPPRRDESSGERHASGLLLPAVLGGVGLVGVAGFAYLGLKGNHDRDEMARTCKPDCSTDDVDSARLKLTLANVSLGVGIAALGAGAYFFFTRPTERSTAMHVRVAPVAGGMAAGLGGRF